MDLKEPLSIEKQVERLKEHGMIGIEKEEAKKFLEVVSYYRFSGYALQYRISPENSDFRCGECSFQKIRKIYDFDSELRHILRKHVESVELYFRTRISCVFSLLKCVQSPHDQHYDRNNFYQKDYYDQVMENFDKQKKYYKDSLIAKHHQLKYGDKYPLWVMAEMISFSNLSKLYASMYYSDKEKIADSIGTGREVLENHMHCLSVLRNKCAHAGRLYNTVYNPPVKLSKKFLRNNNNVSNSSLFAYILVLIKRLPDEKEKLETIKEIEELIIKYKEVVDLRLIGFPDNYKEIFVNNRV